MSPTVEERLRTYSTRLDQAIDDYADHVQSPTDLALRLPEPTPDHRSGRRRFALAAIACLVASAGAAAVIVRRDPSSRSVAATTPGAATTTSAAVRTTSGDTTVPSGDTQDPGVPAVWFINSHDDVTSASTSFTAYVSRLACNSGVTGEVLQPTIEKFDTRIVVTFTVKAASPGGGTCQGNDRVPIVVDLGEAIGDRQLVDGECRSGEAATTAFCVDGSVRWKP